MSVLNQLGTIFDFHAVIVLLVRVVSALLCLTVHELCHGYTAYRLGDPTAKLMGRLSLNPLAHVDLWGFALLILAGFGWAKPVPVDPRFFKKPKQGMALTALAGPLSNFIMAFLAALLLRVLYELNVGANMAGVYLMSFISVLFTMNLGLGIFNLFPIPPLDGSKVVFSVLPDKIYGTILHYERYIMLLLFALVFFDVLNAPLAAILNFMVNGICRIVGLPVQVPAILMNFIYLS